MSLRRKHGISRRSLLVAAASATLLSPISLAGALSMPQPLRFQAPYNLTADDIAWFRSFKSHWISVESGAPGLIPGDVDLNTFADEIEDDTLPSHQRYEAVVCAFFLNASFSAGYYPLANSTEGKSGVVVSPDHIALLKGAFWRSGMIDGKRPYGNYTHYTIDMAHLLGRHVWNDESGYARISGEAEKELQHQHRMMTAVLQAYIEHATIEPGPKFVPYDGFEQILKVRCSPISPAAVERYRQKMDAIYHPAKTHQGSDDVIDKLTASAELFEP